MTPLKVVLVVFVVLCYKEVYGDTTAFPEICRIMSKYRNCVDSETYRKACPNECTAAREVCDGLGLPLDSSKTMCWAVSLTHTSTWPLSHEFCLAHGGKMVPIKTAEDSALLEHTISNLPNTNTIQEVHVGGINMNRAKQWQYIDGTLLTSDLSNWWSGFPKDHNSKPGCMQIRLKNNAQQKNDNCDYNHNYICEISYNTMYSN